MSKATRATRMLEQAGIAFTVHAYDYNPDADSIGLQAAAALGEPPQRVLKTLMALVDGKPVCVIVPSDREVSMKRLAAALSGKSAQMMKSADAERLSGYKVGGISPFGQMRNIKAAIEEQSIVHDPRLHQWRPARTAGAAVATRRRYAFACDRCTAGRVMDLRTSPRCHIGAVGYYLDDPCRLARSLSCTERLRRLRHLTASHKT